MLVHFVVPTPQYVKNREVYAALAEAVMASNHQLTRDLGVEVATQIEMGLSMLDEDDWEMICKRELEHLERCDALIVDATDKSTFGAGYQAAIAIAKNKPTLLLLKEGSMGGSFINGLRHPLLMRRRYNGENIQSVVQEFLQEVGASL